MAFLALGTAVVIRYAYWRVTGTLPTLDDPVSFGLGVVLALAELYCVLILTVSLIINVAPLARGAAPVLPESGPSHRRHLHSVLQRIRRDPGPHAGGGAQPRLPGRPRHRLAAGRRRHGPEMRRPGPRQGRRGAGPPRRAAGALRRAGRPLPDPGAQRARQGRQPQQRPDPGPRRPRSGARRRPRAVPAVPAGDRGPVRPRPEAVPGADPARLHQPGPDRAEPADLHPDAVRERDVLRGHAGRPRQVERLVLLRLGRAPPAERPRRGRRVLGRHDHGGLRDRLRAARPRMDQRLCRPAADRRPPARDLRRLHRPAGALVPGHVPDHAPEESAVQARPEADPEALLPVEHDLLVLPAAAPDLHARAAAAHLLRCEDLRLLDRRGAGLHGDLRGRQHDDAELPLRPRALAVGLRTLRVRAGRLPRPLHRLGGAVAPQAELHRHQQGPRARPRPPRRGWRGRSSRSSGRWRRAARRPRGATSTSRASPA